MDAPAEESGLASYGEALLSMESAILALPDNSSYVAALEKCPELIGEESSSLRFLRFCKNDTNAAARRLLEYWRLRLHTFGPERCYLPVVDFSGQGALDEEVIQVLDKGWAYLLPPNNCGKMVIFADYSNTSTCNKRLGISSNEVKMKITFLYMQLVCQRDFSLECGAIYVRLIREKRQSFSPAMVQYLKRAAQDAFPVAVQAFHYVVAPRDLPEKKRGHFVKNTIPYMWQLLKQNYNFTRRTMDFLPVEKGTKAGDQRADVAKFLMDRYGLLPGSLPSSAGGKWTYNRMKQALTSGEGLEVYYQFPPTTDVQHVSSSTAGDSTAN